MAGPADAGRIEEAPQRENAAPDPLPWTTRVRLTLPQLGEVTADLVLLGQTLKFRLSAAQAGTQTALSQGQGALAATLKQAGIQLAGFQVSGDEPF